jgi:hypothetical protein
MYNWQVDAESYSVKKIGNFRKINKIYIDKEKRKWYYRLVEKEENATKFTTPLLSEHSIGELSDKLVVCQYINTRLYTIFDSYLEFSNKYNMIEPSHRCFYEVIFGNLPQKPHFDIDIDLNRFNVDKDEILNNVLKSIKNNLKIVGIELNECRDVMIFSSHSAIKISFHIVIDNYCHSDNNEAKQFYKKVLEELPKEYCNYVDHAVYSKTQQFRMVGCQKYGSNRPKIFMKEKYEFIETPENPKHELNMTLSASLVSNTSYCKLLPSFFSEDDKPQRTFVDDVSDQDIKNATQLLLDEKSTYKILSVVGGIISLKRLRPSFCKVCNRVHENENPYIMIIEDNVYFDCRRSAGKKYFLGKIPKLTSLVRENLPTIPSGLTSLVRDENNNLLISQNIDIPDRLNNLSCKRKIKEPISRKIQSMTEEESFNIMKSASPSLDEWGK